MSVALDSSLGLSSVETFSTPFEFFVSPEALRDDLSARVLEWFETEAPWKLVETDFYEQYEFSLWDVDVPSQLLVLLEPGFLNELKRKVGDLFAVEFSNDIDVAAHKLCRRSAYLVWRQIDGAPQRSKANRINCRT